jgi:alkylresorcinol/alkylpyrone synthase
MACAAEQQLARHGNLSSVSILAVIEEWQQSRAAAEPGHGLLIAFGPGFSCAMVLLEA